MCSFKELLVSLLEFFDSEFSAGKDLNAGAKLLTAMGFFRPTLRNLRLSVLTSTDSRLLALACFTAAAACLRPGEPLWSSSEDAAPAQPALAHPFSTAALRLFPEGTGRPSRLRTLPEIQRRGRWAQEMSVRRYERSSRVASQPNRLSASLRASCRLADWIQPDLFAGKDVVPPLPTAVRRRLRT